MVFGEAPERVRERNAGIPIHGDVTDRKWHKATARTGQGKQGGGGKRRRRGKPASRVASSVREHMFVAACKVFGRMPKGSRGRSAAS